jgi:outer membrane protein assembly factor BamB
MKHLLRSFRVPARVRICLTAVMLASAAPVHASWPTWRGPSGNGSIASGEFPTQWKAESAAWKFALPGKGSSSPIVSGGKIFLTSPSDGEDSVLALDLAGKLLWQVKLGPEDPPKHRTLGSSCNASPTTDGTTLFAYFKSGHFAALDFSGKVLWKQNLAEQFGRERLFWDQGSSPVVTDDHVILSRMHQGVSWVAVFDKATGMLMWKVDRTFKAPTENDNGYATPVFFEQNGKTAFLVWAADRLTAHSATDGSPLWSVDGFNPEGTGFWPAIASPVIEGGIAVVPVGRDDRPNQARVHGIKLGGKGDVTASNRAWKRDDVGVFVCSPVAHVGRVYLLRHKGEIVCLDPADGKTIWTGSLPKATAPYYSSPTIANGILYAAREDGVVFAAKVGEKFELLGENPMGERIIASPVPVAGKLLIRGDKHLFCVAK